MGPVSYALCAVTSVVCLVFLLRSYFRIRTPLLLYSSICFFFLAIQNGLLFIDLVLVPQIDLTIWRTLAGFVGPTVLLAGIIWERR